MVRAAWELEARHAPPGADRVGVPLLVEHLLVLAAFHRFHSVAVVEQPLANAKATASPKQRLILLRRLCFVFISVSFFC